jgi:hypothetical protein
MNRGEGSEREEGEDGQRQEKTGRETGRHTEKEKGEGGKEGERYIENGTQGKREEEETDNQ